MLHFSCKKIPECCKKIHDGEVQSSVLQIHLQTKIISSDHLSVALKVMESPLQRQIKHWTRECLEQLGLDG
jgi:hypothetical protein